MLSAPILSGVPPSGYGTGTLRAVLAEAKRRLARAAVPDPGLEARLLLEEFAGVTALEAMTGPDRPLPAGANAAFDAALARRVGGEPLFRILGWREFYGLKLRLSPETLEPRPDTETLVDAVLPFVRETARREGFCLILDLGTGTGAIALALLAQVPEAEAVGVDVSAGALETAAENAARLGLADRFMPLLSDWFAQVSTCAHVIAANPPYIKAEEMAGLPEEVARFDPSRALFGGPDGLDAYRAIATGTGAHLLPGGRVAVEIGHEQRDAVTAVFAKRGFPLLAGRKDFGGRDRVLLFSDSEWAWDG